MQKFETRTSQLGLVGGIRQQASDLIIIATPGSLFAPEARKGTLYILVEADAAAPRSQQACQLAARTIRRVFYEDSTVSITAALRRAVSAANKEIYQQNIAQPAGKRATVGVTVAALKDDDLFVAQVQPAQAYVINGGELRAMPAHPSWDPAHVSAAPFMRGGAMGASLFIEPELYRCTLRPNQAAILCSSDFAPLLARDETDALLHTRDADAVAERLHELALQHDLGDAHALAIELRPPLSPAAEREPLSPAGVSERGRLAARSLRGWLSTLTGEAALIARRRRTEAAEASPPPDPMRTMPEQPRHSASPPSRPAPINIGEGLGERYARSQQERERANTSPELPPSAYLGEGTYPTPSRRIDLGDGPSLAAQARPYRSRYEMRPFVDLSWGERLALPFNRIWLAIDEARRSRSVRPKTPPAPVVRGQGLSYRRTRPAFPWLLLLVLVMVVSALIVYGMSITRQNDQQIALEYFTAAEGRLAIVREAVNEADALSSLDLARQAIDEVRASPNVTDTNPTLWLRYQELQREYERALAAVQRLTFFDSPTVLSTYPLPAGSFTSVVVPPATSVVTDPVQLDALRYIYALGGDKASAQLYRIPRDGGTPQPYLRPNDQIGQAVVGPLRAALWRIDQVVAVDQAPEGFGYYFRNGNEWNYSKLGGSEIWSVRDRLSIREYDGNLYIWGAVPNEVLKFQSGNYGDTPEYWLDPAGLADVDISGAVDMSVDGAIYLLKPNGTVLTFSQGRPVGEIKPEAISPPISAVTHFFITSDGSGGGSIFLVETLSERIIQMDKVTGKVVQQIKVRPDGDLRLDKLDGIFVDNSSARPTLYLVNGDQIIRAELPAPPRPFRDQSAAPTPAPTAGP
ncbi:hypothetical protein K2Z83_05425 [Oscillochloris sp. ZM17-4]|uniref:hypothetical protein n=1 Tax=Oscillochloris sp. ZM17-4 TaxID=2866714 RepID=UPI001C73B2CB|nr:hypothetical protein [Oscillochloris sp. ZM17-4]MBX0327122.1 hypothetical protein [Oscillochloris sp. ZM17-4]